MRRPVAAAVGVLLAVLLAGPAVADSFNDATLIVSPNPAVFTDSNASFEFTGCGYDPDAGGVVIMVTGPEATSFFGGPTDAAGCIDITWNGFVTGSGTYDVDAVQEYQRGQTVHQVLRAEATLVVTAA